MGSPAQAYGDLLRVLGSTERRVLDMQRNAAAWIACQCRVVPPTPIALPSRAASSAQLGDDSLRSLPHLAALGYLVAAGGELPGELPVRTSLRRTAQRRPHTPEGTGIADNPVVLVGLLLLAQQADEVPVAAWLSRILDEGCEHWQGGVNRFLLSLAHPDTSRLEAPVPGALGAALALLADSGPPAVRAFRRVGARARFGASFESAQLSADIQGLVCLVALHQRLHPSIDGADPTSEPPDYYLSYAAHERDRARALHARWRGHLRIYADFELLPGAKVDEENPRHLAAARGVLVLVPSNPVEDWYQAEDIARAVDEARGRDVPLVPIVEDRVQIPAMPYGLRRVVPLVLDEVVSSAAQAAMLIKILGHQASKSAPRPCTAGSLDPGDDKTVQEGRHHQAQVDR